LASIVIEEPSTRTAPRLVADAFIDKIDGKNLVNHIDSKKSNNLVSNLEWVSSLENNCHSKLKLKYTSKYVHL
jgi:hypothetical protein